MKTRSLIWFAYLFKHPNTKINEKKKKKEIPAGEKDFCEACVGHAQAEMFLRRYKGEKSPPYSTHYQNYL